MTTGELVYRTTAAALASMPRTLRRRAVSAAGTLAWLCSPSKRRNVATNAAAAGAPLDGAGVRGVFRCHVANLAGMFASGRRDTSPDAGIRIEGRNVLDEALAGGGAILATAHVGDWERAARHLASLGYRLHVVAGVQMNSLLTGALKSAKETRRIEVVGPGDSWRRLFRALAGGGVVALLLDGDVFSGGDEIGFFGRPVRVPAGAARLARATGRPIIVGWTRREETGGLSIHLERLAGGGDAEINRRLFGRLEEIIRSNVDQWCIFRDFFGTGR